MTTTQNNQELISYLQEAKSTFTKLYSGDTEHNGEQAKELLNSITKQLNDFWRLNSKYWRENGGTYLTLPIFTTDKDILVKVIEFANKEHNLFDGELCVHYFSNHIELYIVNDDIADYIGFDRSYDFHSFSYPIYLDIEKESAWERAVDDYDRYRITCEVTNSHITHYVEDYIATPLSIVKAFEAIKQFANSLIK